MTEEKFICQYCGRDNFKRRCDCTLHENSCKNNPNRIVKIRPKSSRTCDKCGREITNCNFKKHYDSCNGIIKKVYHLDHDDLFCKFCGKECKNKNSLVQHEIQCKENSNNVNNIFKCEFCNRCFSTASGLGNHKKYCNNNPNRIDHWLVGLTKETSKSIQKGIDTFHKHLVDGSIKLSSGTASTPENEQKRKEKISNSMQLAVKEGRHKTSYNSGSGYKSYIQIFDQTYFLRSSYELIYSYYLAVNKIKFEVESIRVQAVENPYRKIFISDFYIPAENKIVETKGWETEKDLYEKQSFEKEGYNFQLINSKEIDIIKKKLINYIDIENILNQLKSNQNNIYYTFDLTQYYK